MIYHTSNTTYVCSVPNIDTNRPLKCYRQMSKLWLLLYKIKGSTDNLRNYHKLLSELSSGCPYPVYLNENSCNGPFKIQVCNVSAVLQKENNNLCTAVTVDPIWVPPGSLNWQTNLAPGSANHRQHFAACRSVWQEDICENFVSSQIPHVTGITGPLMWDISLLIFSSSRKQPHKLKPFSIWLCISNRF